MFTVEFAEYYGPFAGNGGYGGGIGRGMSKSPRVAVEKARKAQEQLPEGGGVPILGWMKIWKDGKLVSHKGD